MKMCQALAQLGHQVTLIAINNSREIEPGIIDIYHFYNVEKTFDVIKPTYLSVRGKSFFYAPAALRVLQKIQPDLVYGRLIPGCYLAAKNGFPTVLEYHTPIRKIKWLEYRSFEKIIKLPHFRKFVVISAALKKHYQEEHELPEEKILVAHDSSDTVDLKTIGAVSLGGKGRIQVGYVGHLYPGKGMEIIEKIVPRLPKFDFHIIGGTEKDILLWKDRLREDNVFFHGFLDQSRLASYLKSLDVCLLPNQRKVTVSGLLGINKVDIGPYTSPLKMFDYMAYGKAIVASDLSVLREVLSHEKNALLCSPESTECWVTSLNKLTDTRVRAILGKKAREDFEQHYSWKKRAEFVLANY